MVHDGRHEGVRRPYVAAARTGLIAICVIVCAIFVYVRLAPNQPNLANPEQFARAEQAHHSEPYDCHAEERSGAAPRLLRKDNIRSEHCARKREEDRREQDTRWQAVRTADATEQAAIEAQRQAVAAAASVAILIIALGASIWAAWAASQAAKSADETLVHARESSEKELRAYVFPEIEGEPINDELVDRMYIKIRIVNTGKTPAYKMEAIIHNAEGDYKVPPCRK